MDRSLADFYKTQENLGVLSGGYTGEDLQKQAAAEFLVKLAAEEGVDLNTLSDTEVGSLLAEVESGMIGQTKTAAAEETEMQEKLAESDFLGRAMAHAYVDELAAIEKQAGVVDKGKAAVKAVGGFLKGQAKNVKEGVTGITREKVRGPGWEGIHSLPLNLKERAKKLLPAAATATGLGAGAVALHHALKEKEAKSSNAQFEQAAMQRAQEMLAEAGYEKQAEDIGSQVEVRALQMLEEAGYPVQWNQ